MALPSRTKIIKNWHIVRLFLCDTGARAERIRRTLPLEEYLEKIDKNEVEKIAQTYYSTKAESREGFKYVDSIPKNLRTGAGHVLDLDLDIAPPRRILDLGCGAGYFLFVCQLLGHDCLGLDAPFVPAYKAMTQLLGIQRVTWEIKAFEALPDLGEQFDLITAFRIFFNGRKTQLWGPAEWNFFFEDVSKHLKPNGLLQLRLNGSRARDCYTPELLSFFLSRGAEVYRSTVRLRRENLLQTQNSAQE